MGFHTYKMKTHFISANNYLPKYNLSTRTNNNYQTMTQNKTCGDSCEINFTGKQSIKDIIIKKLNLNPIYHFKKFTLEEYSKLSQTEIATLRAKYDKIIKHCLWTDWTDRNKIKRANMIMK